MTSESNAGSEYARQLAENQRSTDAFDRSALTAAPLSGLAIVTCMDARLDVEEALGFRTGSAHIIRNAGGIVTDDVIRSLIISQQLLGTDEIVVIEPSGCGLRGADEGTLRDRVADMAQTRPEAVAIEFGASPDLGASVRAQEARLEAYPFLCSVPVHGLTFDVATGRLDEIIRARHAGAR